MPVSLPLQQAEPMLLLAKPMLMAVTREQVVAAMVVTIVEQHERTILMM